MFHGLKQKPMILALLLPYNNNTRTNKNIVHKLMYNDFPDNISLYERTRPLFFLYFSA